MGLDLFNKLQKLEIYSFNDKERKEQIGKPFEVMFNPDSFSISHVNNFIERKVINTQGQPQFMGQSADRINLNLVVDGTGVVDFGVSSLLGLGTKSVSEQIKQFLKVCFKMNEDKHEPRFLKINWGDSVLKDFRCRLESVVIEYNLFDKNGVPLHAVLKTSFVGDTDLLRRALEEQKSSPDLSHSRVVKSGDTLPLLSKEIYGSSQYYLRVAQANNIDDFRNLTPGQEIIFPPLAKQRS